LGNEGQFSGVCRLIARPTALQFLQLSRGGGQDARRTAGETPALPGLFAGSFCRFDLYK